MDNWQIILKQSKFSLSEILHLKNLSIKDFKDAPINSESFILKVTQRFINKIEKSDPFDPLLLQILPTQSEQEQVIGYDIQPLKENKLTPISGLVHKFENRVLATMTQACAIHCRYCFRQNFDYKANVAKQMAKQIASYIDTNNIYELILSGGDPLMLSNKALEDFLQIALRPKIKVVRFHTRIPSILPERFDEELLEILTKINKKIVIVLHINHANELDEDILNLMRKLQKLGITLLNQSVLLKGVNDSVLALTDLSFALFNAGILPYYLHQLDKVKGSQRFEVSLEKTLQIYDELQAKLPGYLVPKLVKEEFGAKNKILVT
jgi:EF-P beta-lysylation protein EpmB